MRKIFKNANQAIRWEHKVLRKIGVAENYKWLNLSGGIGEPGRKYFDFEKRQQAIKKRIVQAGIEWQELCGQVDEVAV